MFYKFSGLIAALTTALTFGATPVLADGHDARSEQLEIRVKCARYLSTGVIWDRPMGEFLDDLRRAGYSPERAKTLGDLVCRDERLVGNTTAMGQRMMELMRQYPPS